MNYEGEQIRTVVDENGETLWVAKDVAEVLGYKNTSKAISDHCRGVTKRYPIVDSLGRRQDVRVIHLADLFRLVNGSELEGAVRFESWIHDDVLPSIHRTGTYTIEQPTIAVRPRTLTKVSADFRALLSIAKTAGLSGNQAILSANQGMIKLYEENPMDLVGSVR